MHPHDEAEDAFWQDLCQALEQAERETAALDSVGTVDAESVAAAERLLAEVDAAVAPSPVEPLDPKLVEDLLGRALVVGPRPSVRGRGRHVVRQGWRRMVAAAAVLCLSPAFLLGAGAAAAVVTVVVRNVIQLDHRDAVRYMVSDGSTEAQTNPTQGITAARLFWGVRELQKWAVDPEPAIREAARTGLTRLQAELVSTEPFVLHYVPGDYAELYGIVTNSEVELDARCVAVKQLTDLFVDGVAALNEVERMPQPDAIRRDNALIRQRLQEWLAEPIEATGK